MFVSKNTISLTVNSHEDGNENMSYHVQQNTQQRSVGIFIVIAFHVLLIWALANGLGKGIGIFEDPDPITLTPVEKQITPPTLVQPLEPIIQKPTKITIVPTTFPVITIESAQPPVVVGTGGDESIILQPSISKPKLIKANKPDYPTTASRLGEEGTTGLKLFITSEGRVADVQLMSSSGSARLDEAAIRHAKRNWAFSPCVEAGSAVACWHQTKLVWRLEDAAR